MADFIDCSIAEVVRACLSSRRPGDIVLLPGNPKHVAGHALLEMYSTMGGAGSGRAPSPGDNPPSSASAIGHLIASR